MPSFTRFGSLGTGRIRSGLIGAAVAGSVLLVGNQYTERAENTAPTQYLGTGAYLAYTDTVCTATGGKANYTSCSISNPFSTGAWVIDRVQLDAYTSPAAAKVNCGVVSALTASGTSTNFTKKTTATGSSVVFSTGSLQLQYDEMYKCVATTNPGPWKAQLRVWPNAVYRP